MNKPHVNVQLSFYVSVKNNVFVNLLYAMLSFSYSSSNGAVIIFGDNKLLQSRGFYVIENVYSKEFRGYVE